MFSCVQYIVALVMRDRKVKCQSNITLRVYKFEMKEIPP